MASIAAREPDIGVVNSGTRRNPPDAPYFALELEPGEPGGLVFAAAVCSEGESPEEVEVRRYAITLLYEFFRRRGEAVKVPDYRVMLRNSFRHIHRHILEKWGEHGPRLDLLLVLADPDRLYAARCGEDALFLYREEEAKALFTDWRGDNGLLGRPGEERVDIQETPVRPGDIVVLCNPSVARVMGTRDITVILRRARETRKAALFLSAIAERKGAEGVLAALVWEVPNYRGAVLLDEELPSEEAPPPGDTLSEEEVGESAEGGALGEKEHAERAKRQWLSKWRRREGE